MSQAFKRTPRSHLTSYARRHVAMMDVGAELMRQDKLWGRPEDQTQTAEERLAILVEEVGEVARAVLDRRPYQGELRESATKDIRTELVQVAAVAIANIQRLDRGLDQ